MQAFLEQVKVFPVQRQYMLMIIAMRFRDSHIQQSFEPFQAAMACLMCQIYETRQRECCLSVELWTAMQSRSAGTLVLHAKLAAVNNNLGSYGIAKLCLLTVS